MRKQFANWMSKLFTNGTFIWLNVIAAVLAIMIGIAWLIVWYWRGICDFAKEISCRIKHLNLKSMKYINRDI